MKIKVQTRKRTNAGNRKAKGTIAILDAAATRPHTLVRVPSNPLQNKAALFTRMPTMESALRVLLINYMKMKREQGAKLAPHSITLHEDRCTFGAVLWPRASSGPDLDEMQDAVIERDEDCCCHPLVLYPGAMA